MPPTPVPESEPGSVASTEPWALSWLNVAVAILLLIAAAPLMLIAALLIRATSPGPVLFKQVRVGLDQRRGSDSTGSRRRSDLGGRPIQIYKFRTMYVDSGGGRQVWTETNDRRVTPVGRVLRAYRIDELPQIVNVLQRDMNVVGPRPEQPRIFARLRARHPGYSGRQRALPGITGLAQVRCGYGGDDLQVRRKLAYDLKYVQGRSWLLDLTVLFQTVPVVLLRRGAR
jgi:lipopolysaccharide/colanic/teichoic acid biosynthesis glycosyltransferase